MIREYLVQSDLLLLPLIALGIFFLTFVAVLLHVLTGKRKAQRWSRLAALPLEEDCVIEPDGSGEVATVGSAGGRAVENG
jgi:cbb3-type cytochrome oxidase subunit 3